jgi:phosphoribosyl 1,2-cyclic phosphodiesterase
MIKVCVLASGSTGNAIFVRDEHTRLLIDAGISRPLLDKRLALIGEDAMDLDAVAITHEHTDHVGGLKGLLVRYQAPVFCTDGAYEAVGSTIRNVAGRRHRLIIEEPTRIGSLQVMPLCVPHDANQPVACVIYCGDKSVVIATDLAYIEQPLRDALLRASFVFLESNHDIDKLAGCSYPEAHKQRVRENHLSNVQAAEAIAMIADRAAPPPQIILGHLSGGSSGNSNDVETAGATVAKVVGPDRDLRITILPQGEQSVVFEV